MQNTPEVQLTMPSQRRLLNLATRLQERATKEYRDIGPISDTQHLDHIAVGYVRAAIGDS